MKRLRIFQALSDVSPGALHSPVVALGTFDGVHRGHQAVVRTAVDWAAQREGEAVVLTFRRHPRRVLSGKAPSLLISLDHRLELLEALGVETAVVIPFSRDLADTPPDTFIREVLVGILGVRGVVLGFNAGFGRGKAGNLALLQQLGPSLGFEAREVAPVEVDGQSVSSSRVRALIKEGNLESAERMLGRPVSVMGTVVPGRSLGRDLGFPTANLSLHHKVKPPAGVYSGRLHLEGKTYRAVVNIGTAPTVSPELPEATEVHILDFSGDLYGTVIRVDILKSIRPEKRFDTLDDLTEAIRQDIRVAREE
ncbi:MAG: bifunctional riboflavin kinase/FAD synthetase [Planctomycetota bacterium]